MATSNSYNFTVDRDQIIYFALRKLTVLKRGQTPAAEDISDAAIALNMIVQQWRERSDGAASMKMWLRKRLKLFFALTQVKYSIPGNNITEVSELATTTLTAAATSTITLTVASISGIASGDYAGIVENSGSITWTTVNGTPSGSTVTLSAAVTAAAIGNKCYFYTIPAVAPVSIIGANLVTPVDQETPLGVFDIGAYWAIGNKNVAGVPGNLYQERTRDGLDIYFDTAINDTDYLVNLLVHYPIQDFDASTDNPDFPKQWFRALGYMLAVDLAPEYGMPLGDLSTLAADAIAMARGSDPETTDLCFDSSS